MAREIIYKAMLQRYEAEVADADAKIQILLTTARIIPEHIDITGEIDKLLGKIEHAESKMAILKRKYGINQAANRVRQRIRQGSDFRGNGQTKNVQYGSNNQYSIYSCKNV